MSVKIIGKGLQGMINDLRDIEVNGPRRVQQSLDGALRRTADTSRDLAHVSHDVRHSGSLKASQKVTSEHGSGEWTGSIAYGDRGAHFELARGGEHAAFVDALAALSDPDFERALLSGFSEL